MQIATKERKEQFKRFGKNLTWFQSHYEELKRQYNNEYVAIDNEGLLDHDPDLETLVERIRRENGDLVAVVIEYLTDKKLQLLL
jgi:hypothetical protein